MRTGGRRRGTAKNSEWTGCSASRGDRVVVGEAPTIDRGSEMRQRRPQRTPLGLLSWELGARRGRRVRADLARGQVRHPAGLQIRLARLRGHVDAIVRC